MKTILQSTTRGPHPGTWSLYGARVHVDGGHSTLCGIEIANGKGSGWIQDDCKTVTCPKCKAALEISGGDRNV